MTELFIKNMVCHHCKEAAERLLRDMGYSDTEVTLGKATIAEELSAEEIEKIGRALKEIGLELLTDPESRLVEKAKLLVIRHIREEGHNHNLSECLSRHLNVSYDTVSRVFSQKEGRTLEKYHIAQKVERVKELLQGGEHTLEEIADMAGYSSAAHLSRQFKVVTGMSPTRFIQTSGTRKPLNEI